MTISIAAVIILIAVIGFAIMKKKGNNEESKPDNSTSDTPASKPENSVEDELKSIMDSLLTLNILMRKDRNSIELFKENLK